ncbi:MAG TPA: lipopolysaccharide assembly protein LapA domain-containing protein [Mycobacterium sp.]|nr:lipopolysaccharide assembly protein LapA domain-containing protein [Mycobacterium sp.]
MSTDPNLPPVEPGPLGSIDPIAHGPRLDSPAPKPPPPENAVKFTRAAALWSSLIVGFLILIVLLIFIAQNTESATFHFLGWDWSLPLGVAILLAAVLGGLITVLAGAARIVQLRRAAKKNYKAALR